MNATLRLQPRWPYLTLLLMGLQRALAYRMTLLIGMLSGLINLVLLYYLWQTIYHGQTQVGQYDWSMMRTYLVLSYAVNGLLTWRSQSNIFRTIRTGEVANELLRPLDYFGMQLAQTTGTAIVEGGISALLALAVGLLWLDVAPPVSPSAGGLFLLSVVLGFLIKFLISFLIALLCFWTINSVGLMWAQNALVGLFSGALIPLNLLPAWLQTLMTLTPFQGILFIPLSIYLGTVQGLALGGVLLLQIGWIAALTWLAYWLWQPAIRVLEIQGG